MSLVKETDESEHDEAKQREVKRPAPLNIIQTEMRRKNISFPVSCKPALKKGNLHNQSFFGKEVFEQNSPDIRKVPSLDINRSQLGAKS